MPGAAAMSAQRLWRESMFGRTPGESSQRLGLAAVGVLMFVLLSLQYENFGTSRNVTSIALNMAPLLIASIGTAALLIAGQVDLSIGSMYAFLSVIIAMVARSGAPAWQVVAAGLLGGAACGLLNGTLVQLLKISPLIVTIGMLAIYRGASMGFDAGRSVFGFEEDFLAIARTQLWGIDLPIYFAFAIFLLGGFILTRTRVGLHIYAVGGDKRSARLAGIRANRLILGLYTVNGLLIGAISVLTVSRLGSASFNIGTGFEFDVLTATILGGVAFTGGAGRPLGVLIGVATISVLNAGVLFMGLQSFIQSLAKGGLLLVALGADEVSAVLRARRLTRTDRDGLDVSGVDDGDGKDTRLDRRPDGWRPGPVVLETSQLTQRYGAVVAVSGVSLTVRAGEVLALLGDNGAGKSSLIRMISGAETPQEGSLEIDGVTVTFNGAGKARRAGVETVYQDLALCPNLDIIHNLVLGDEPVKRILGVTVRDEMRAREIATARIKTLGTRIRDLDVIISSLSGGQRQAVAIARSFTGEPKLVILDEPTAALGVAQKQQVLLAVRRLADDGVAVILVTHDIPTVGRVADRVAVLRLGQLIFDDVPAGLTEMDLIRLMSGEARAADLHTPGSATASRA